MVQKTRAKSALRGTHRKAEFLPLIVKAFIQLGYRRTTTARLAEQCQVRENELYRIWPNKKSMFLEAIQYVFDLSVREWSEGILPESDLTAAEQLLVNQSKSRGKSQLHRIVSSGLSEVDDADIRKALRHLYLQFHEVLAGYVHEHRQQRGITSKLDPDETAWSIIGLGSIFDIQNDLGIESMKSRRQILAKATNALLNGTDHQAV